MAKKWAEFPHADKAYVYDAAGLKKTGRGCTGATASRCQRTPDVLDAWQAYHAGDFARAVAAGRKLATRA